MNPWGAQTDAVKVQYANDAAIDPQCKSTPSALDLRILALRIACAQPSHRNLLGDTTDSQPTGQSPLIHLGYPVAPQRIDNPELFVAVELTRGNVDELQV